MATELRALSRESVPFRIRTADGETVELSYSSPRTTRTIVGAARLTSSSPSKLHTSTACRVPSVAMAPASGSSNSGLPTPRSWYGAFAGFASGPSRLNSVRTPSLRRRSATCAIPRWNCGA